MTSKLWRYTVQGDQGFVGLAKNFDDFGNSVEI